MTPEKAIEILNNYEHGFFGYKIDEVKEALNLAVKALKGMALPVAKITFDGKTTEEIRAEIINNFRSAGIELQASEQEEQTKGDLISREALKKYARVVFDKDLGRLRVVDVSNIDNAPTVVNEMLKSERPKGKWITRTEDNGVNYRFYCSCCNREVLLITEFCPNCGADMRGEE